MDWSKSILAFKVTRARLSVCIERWGLKKEPETQNWKESVGGKTGTWRVPPPDSEEVGPGLQV